MNEQTVRQYAYKLLAGRELSQQKLIHKLIALGAEAQMATRVVNALAEEGLQSDARVLDGVLRSGIRKGQGPLKIQQRIHAQQVEQTTTLPVNEAEWLRVAIIARIKKFGSAIPVSTQEKGRQYRFLVQRGFQSSIATEALKCTDISEFSDEFQHGDE